MKSKSVRRLIPSLQRGILPAVAACAALVASIGTTHAQVSTGGLVFIGERVVKESMISAAPVKQVASGWNFTVAVRVDGSVAAWGKDWYGQCDVPHGLIDAVQVACGRNHTVILRANGTVVGLGDNQFGQANPPAGLNTVVQVVAGEYYSAALKADGSIVFWGQTGEVLPTMPSNLTGVVQIAAGEHHMLALKSDGSVVAWGTNTFGQTNVPSGLGSVKQVLAHFDHSAVLLNDGTIRLWGQPGVSYNVPPTTAIDVKQLALGASHAIALKNDGTVINWGTNLVGELAIPAGLNKVQSVSAYQYTSYAVTAQGGVQGWGECSFGETLASPNFRDVAKIAFGRNHLAYIRHDGTVGAWGENTLGQCNVPTDPSLKFSDISAGWSHTVATGIPPTLKGLVGSNSLGQLGLSSPVTDYDKFWAFGKNTYAHRTTGATEAFGDNSYGTANLPSLDYAQVAGGEYHALGLKKDGTVLTAGSQSFNVHVPPPGLSDVVQIACANYLVNLALKSDGTVTAWGVNNTGQTDVPAGLSGVVQVAAGESHVVALKGDGTLVGWGNNVYGLKTGLTGLSSIAQVACGGYTTVCLQHMSAAVAPYAVYGEDSATGKIYLANPAPEGGVMVSLTSSNPVASVPATVTVPQGATSATFEITTTNPSALTQSVITAAAGGITQEILFTVWRSSFRVSQSATDLVGGSTMKDTGTITLIDPAPQGGMTFNITSSDPSVYFNSPITVPAGALTKTFPFNHNRVHTPTPVRISIASADTVRTLDVVINPFQLSNFTVTPGTVLGGSPVTATATLNAVPKSLINVFCSPSDAAAIPSNGYLVVQPNSAVGTLVLPTKAVDTKKTVDITANLDGSNLTKSVKVLSTFTLAQFQTSPIYGNTNVNAFFKIAAPAPTGGYLLNIWGLHFATSATTSIPAGGTATTFGVTTEDVTVTTDGAVTATLGTASEAARAKILPNKVLALSTNLTSVVGGSASTVTGSVTLCAPVAIDVVVTLVSSDPTKVIVPASVVVKAGDVSATFPVTHKKVTVAKNVNISSTRLGLKKVTSLQLLP